ncbi:MAG: histidine kinase dimerization/phosphoacceptor domain -containing protein [Spirochaetota bacterium]
MEDTLLHHVDHEWRRQLLDKTLLVVVTVGVIALVPSLIISFATERWLILVGDLSGWLVAAAFAAWRQLPFTLRACGLIGVLEAVSVLLLIELGPVPPPMLWLVAAVALAQLLLRTRGFLIAMAISLGVLAGCGIAASSSLLQWPVGPWEWAVHTANFAAVALGIAAATEYLIRCIESAFDRESDLLNLVASRHREVRDAHQALQEEHARQEHLVHELHHRVLNNLQTLSSLVELQANAWDVGSDREIVDDLRGRLRCMVAAHDSLSASRGRTHVAADDLLFAVVDEAVSAGEDIAGAPPVTVVGDGTLELDSSHTVPVALICFEWLTAFNRHCSGSKARGRLRYTSDPAPRVTFQGDGCSACLKELFEHLSYRGSVIANSLAAQIGAATQIDYADGRLNIALTLPGGAELPRPDQHRYCVE